MLQEQKIRPSKATIDPETEATMRAGAEAYEQFKTADVRLGIQKGSLFDVTRKVYAEQFGIDTPAKPITPRHFTTVFEGKKIGFAFLKNGELCRSVAEGIVDLTMIGNEKLRESSERKEVEIIQIFPEVRENPWEIILATPITSAIEDLSQIRRISTSYVQTASETFTEWGYPEIEIVPSEGGTEKEPYLRNVDGVVELRSSGDSLRENGLVPWEPIMLDVYPVLIGKKESEITKRLKNHGVLFDSRKANYQ